MFSHLKTFTKQSTWFLVFKKRPWCLTLAQEIALNICHQHSAVWILFVNASNIHQHNSAIWILFVRYPKNPQSYNASGWSIEDRKLLHKCSQNSELSRSLDAWLLLWKPNFSLRVVRPCRDKSVCVWSRVRLVFCVLSFLTNKNINLFG
jgi:hypothetical protein